MNWREFVVSLIRAVAWPSTVVVVILVFRQRLAELLKKRLAKIKFPFLEAELFEHEANEIEETLEQQSIRRTKFDSASDPSAIPAPEHPSNLPASQKDEVGRARPEVSSTTQNAGNDKVDGDRHVPRYPGLGGRRRLSGAWRLIDDGLREAEGISETSPLGAVMIGDRTLEEALALFAQSTGAALDAKENRPLLFSRMASQLNKIGYISSSLFESMIRLHRLRNRVAHSTTALIDDLDVSSYIRSIRIAIETLGNRSHIYSGRVLTSLLSANWRVARCRRATFAVYRLGVDEEFVIVGAVGSDDLFVYLRHSRKYKNDGPSEYDRPPSIVVSDDIRPEDLAEAQRIGVDLLWWRDDADTDALTAAISSKLQ